MKTYIGIRQIRAKPYTDVDFDLFTDPSKDEYTEVNRTPVEVLI